MNAKEIERLIKGDFRKDDYIRDRTTQWVHGRIIGKGTLGRMPGVWFRVKTPRGDILFIHEDNAEALGVYKCAGARAEPVETCGKSGTLPKKVIFGHFTS